MKTTESYDKRGEECPGESWNPHCRKLKMRGAMKGQEIRSHARKRLIRFDRLSCYSDQIFDRKQLKVEEIYLGSQLEEI